MYGSITQNKATCPDGFLIPSIPGSMENLKIPNLFGSLNIDIWDLPFDSAQGGELVEPFGIWCLEFEISQYFNTPGQ